MSMGAKIVIAKLACIAAALLAVGFNSVRTLAAEPVVITTVSGTVLDENSRNPIGNAAVTFVNDSNTISIASTKDGTFNVTLPAGSYRLTVLAKGFEIVTRNAVSIGSEPVNIQISLVISGSLKTIANVSVKRQTQINVTPAAINTMTSEAIQAQGSIGLSRALSEIPGVQI